MYPCCWSESATAFLIGSALRSRNVRKSISAQSQILVHRVSHPKPSSISVFDNATSSHRNSARHRQKFVVQKNEFVCSRIMGETIKRLIKIERVSPRRYLVLLISQSIARACVVCTCGIAAKVNSIHIDRCLRRVRRSLNTWVSRVAGLTPYLKQWKSRHQINFRYDDLIMWNSSDKKYYFHAQN